MWVTDMPSLGVRRKVLARMRAIHPAIDSSPFSGGFFLGSAQIVLQVSLPVLPCCEVALYLREKGPSWPDPCATKNDKRNIFDIIIFFPPLVGGLALVHCRRSRN